MELLNKTELDLLDELERKYKINLRKATADEISSFLSSAEFQVDFSDEDNEANNKFTQVIDLLGKAVEDKEVRDLLKSTSIIYKLELSRTKLVNLFDSFEENIYTREELLDLINAEMNSDEPIYALNACLINLENLLNLSISGEKVVENLKKIRGFSEDIQTSITTYIGKSALIDLVCCFLDSYFRNIGTKICEENPDIWNWVKTEITALQKVEDENFGRISEFDLPEDNQLPEELGLIDITKLNNKENTENGK